MKKRKRKILLVEPPYKSTVLPFSLQKLATYHLSKGDYVKFTHNPFNEFNSLFIEPFDKIYITSIFTYYGQIVIDTINFFQRIMPKAKIKVGGIFASLMPEVIQEKTGVKPHIGIYQPIENQLPNFSLFPKVNQGYLVTSRGCIHKCEFCAVKTIEPKFYLLENWKAQLEHIYQQKIHHICIQDNNFLATPISHQKEVIEYSLKFPKMTIDFNQALEAKLFSEKKAKVILKGNTSQLRFAFDGMHEDKYFQNAVKLARSMGYRKGITAYILYNFTDTPKDFYYRICEAFRLGCQIHPMKYAPINKMNRKFTSGQWNQNQLRGLQKLLSKITVTGSSKQYSKKDKKRKAWLKDFGKNSEEFISKISNPKKIVATSFYSDVRKNKHLIRSGLGMVNKKEIKKDRKKAIKSGVIIKGNYNYNRVKIDYTKEEL